MALTACAVPNPNGTPSAATRSSSPSSNDASSSASLRAIRTGSTALLTERMLSGGLLEIGHPDAHHELVAVVNFTSDYSKAFLSEQLPRLIDDFILTGDLRVKLLPLHINKYLQSDAQAIVMVCSALQGKGETVSTTTLLTENAPLPAAAITTLKLDAVAYKTCVDSPATRTVLEDQANLAKELKATYVPIFFLDNERFDGLPEYPDLRGRIRAAIED